MTHYQYHCKTHGTLMGQCRCPSPNKMIHKIACAPACPEYGGKVIVPETKLWNVVATQSRQVRLVIPAPNPEMRDIIKEGVFSLLETRDDLPQYYEKSGIKVEGPVSKGWAVQEVNEIR